MVNLARIITCNPEPLLNSKPRAQHFRNPTNQPSSSPDLENQTQLTAGSHRQPLYPFILLCCQSPPVISVSTQRPEPANEHNARAEGSMRCLSHRQEPPILASGPPNNPEY